MYLSLKDYKNMEHIFTEGLMFKAPNDKAPEHIKGSLSIKVEEFKQFLDKNNNNGWVNIDLKVGKSGKYYAELNTWKPSNKKEDTSFEDAIVI